LLKIIQIKHLYLILLLSFFTFGQNFELTSSGFVNVEDKSKDLKQ